MVCSSVYYLVFFQTQGLLAWMQSHETRSRSKDSDCLGGVIHGQDPDVVIGTILKRIATDQTAREGPPWHPWETHSQRTRLPCTLVVVCRNTFPHWLKHVPQAYLSVIDRIDGHPIVEEEGRGTLAPAFRALCLVSYEMLRASLDDFFNQSSEAHRTRRSETPAVPPFYSYLWFRIVVHIDHPGARIVPLVMMEAQHRWVVVEGEIEEEGFQALVVWVRVDQGVRCWTNASIRQAAVEQFFYPPCVQSLNGVVPHVPYSPGTTPPSQWAPFGPLPLRAAT